MVIHENKENTFKNQDLFSWFLDELEKMIKPGIKVIEIECLVTLIEVNKIALNNNDRHFSYLAFKNLIIHLKRVMTSSSDNQMDQRIIIINGIKMLLKTN